MVTLDVGVGLSLRPGLRSAGPERIRKTLYIFVICAAEMLSTSVHVR